MKQKIEKALENVFIIENKKNIIESGIVKKIDVFKDEIRIYISLYNPTMHIKKKLEKDIYKSIKYQNIDTKKIRIKIEIQLEDKDTERKIPGIKNIIAVASGKGGVGKSTISTNISVSLMKMGFHVGLLDADIYGPSIPLMFNLEEEKVHSCIIKKNKGLYGMNPITSYGVKILSLGFFSKYGEAIVWRGPMATKALRQLIHETNWGLLDFLIVDLPPGTGDIHLSILQEISLKGIVIVSTPQKIALSDVHRSVGMFRIPSIKVPILGIIENMSFLLTKEKETKKKYYLFGKNGVKNFANEMNIFFLGEIPLLQEIREYSDLGIPVVLKNDQIKKIFEKITKNIIEKLS
ncbi:MAG: Mrp/NBP35 family ATP-binding protein [Flavobacteriales bacterium]|jgi:ATP-binding protein involved in chromosome partitioning|uniref:Mrp/NBP35 family ATP-binding protein n=1 Tax=Blattabacterium sp. (Mastotermes darwiniensis) TaxID=39768 RepID=UPI000231DF93|nr:Mrp/NBP35 family ATP-binding protein [Blattabacterium sp. (Mastotermes darwiniensis)]AER40427.1 Mrp/Nbp35 family ATP-binding protein [Blattabacterium sp. (Mastotermes darwiniensis) str. MADAR]MDR1804851.1 Mrp/NBP35 family ATP-binding protein [Flavobacteriales bacterium]